MHKPHVVNIPVMSLTLWANPKVKLYACSGGPCGILPHRLSGVIQGDSGWMVKVDKGRISARNRSSGDVQI